MSFVKDKTALFFKGDKANPAIIFAHGFPFDHRMWQSQVDELSSKYFCISYDIRGLGESSPGDGQFTMEMFADDLLGIIKAKKLKKPVLCGLSMGGYIALRAVEKNENLVRALILCDTKAEADDNEAKIKRADGIKKINELGVEKFVGDFLPNCFAEESLSKPFYHEILERSLKSSPAGVKGCLLAMAGRTDTSGFLERIKIPVLVLCGEKDKLTPPSAMKKMIEPITDYEFHIIPDAGHLSPVENPETVNKIIKDFLSRRLK